ncbi:hypothetical protein C0992_008605 [Termitomyces sp. T32_za158]|nr:hypothetical protein C0992_008605 [Termitomyces sp. T32_za158]
MSEVLENNKENIPPATPAPVSSKKGKQAKSVKKSDALPAKHKHAIWTDNDDKILVNTLLVQHEEGVQTSNGTFKDPAFQAAAAALKESHLLSGGALKSSDSCKTRYNGSSNAQRHTDAVKILKTLSNFLKEDRVMLIRHVQTNSDLAVTI